MEPKTNNYTKCLQRICMTCRYRMSQTGILFCQNPKNFPMGNGIPDVNGLDGCDDHRFKGEE